MSRQTPDTPYLQLVLPLLKQLPEAGLPLYPVYLLGLTALRIAHRTAPGQDADEFILKKAKMVGGKILRAYMAAYPETVQVVEYPFKYPLVRDPLGSHLPRPIHVGQYAKGRQDASLNFWSEFQVDNTISTRISSIHSSEYTAAIELIARVEGDPKMSAIVPPTRIRSIPQYEFGKSRGLIRWSESVEFELRPELRSGRSWAAGLHKVTDAHTRACQWVLLVATLAAVWSDMFVRLVMTSGDGVGNAERDFMSFQFLDRGQHERPRNCKGVFYSHMISHSSLAAVFTGQFCRAYHYLTRRDPDVDLFMLLVKEIS